MMNHAVRRAVYLAGSWAVNQDLYGDVGWAVAGAVSRAVNRAVARDLKWAVDGDVHLAVYETGARREKLPHPGLEPYLARVP